MLKVNSPLSIYFVYLCLCGFSLANETSGENITEPEIPEATREEPESAASSDLPVKSRILDGKPLNLTSFVSIENNYEVEEDPSPSLYSPEPSTTLRCPPASAQTMDFKPSIHIGEIDEYESRKSDELVKSVKSPFNKPVEQIKFDKTVRIDESVDNDGVRVPTSSFRHASVPIGETHRIPVKFFETDGRYSLAVPVDLVHHQHQQHQQEHYEPQQIELQISAHHQQADHTDEATNGDDTNHAHNQNAQSHGQHALVTFEYPRPPVYATPRPVTLTRPLYTSTIKEPSPMHYQQPTRQQHQYILPSDNLPSVHLKPSKLHDDAVSSPPNNVHYHHYQYTPIASGEAIEKPEIQSFHHPPPPSYATGNYHSENNYQPIVSHEEQSHHVGKPDTLYYVSSHHESAITKMRKFPYKFYEPSLVGQQDNQFHYSLQEIPSNFPSKERRVSPWKKIIHLIGAFLPLGLLLATLKPNVVKIENTTQPNIVLSKLRVVDLPAEHKRGRLVDKVQPEACDDRSICELIVSGSQPSSNLLQNILWNFTNRSTEEEAQKHGLQEIFAAVKKKDCSLVDC
ncbi:uncharacterized protein [Venturia canescens]|uniref:uncharacterized protein n=1 Tax=Venturia canescens TaxID=32260 RepID=UPI001C9C2C36|nr:uncharacterized protein LOC122416633 [Venturia canescens]